MNIHYPNTKFEKFHWKIINKIIPFGIITVFIYFQTIFTRYIVVIGACEVSAKKNTNSYDENSNTFIIISITSFSRV